MGSGNRIWKTTNPKVDESISKLLHDHHNKNLKPIVKLLKYWNQEKNAGRLRSYHLEALIWKILRAYPGKITNYSQGIVYFFNNAAAVIAANCEDPTKLGGFIDLYLSVADREMTIKQIEEGKRAIGSPNPFPVLQKENWRRVFGPVFAN